MAKADPLPVFRALTQAAIHRISVDVAKLFDELPIIANVEIVVPLLPEVLGIADQSPRHTLLQRLERFRERRT